jgi:hypothetical protein
MQGYPLSIQLRMTRGHGHLFLAAGRLYFICQKEGGAWAQALGAGLGGALGAVLANSMGPSANGNPVVYDERHLWDAVQQYKGSVVFEAAQIGVIKQTIFWRLIKYQGKTYGLPKGMSKELKAALGPWAKYHNVKTKGF